MASLYLILALIFSLIIAIVALANNQVVTVSYIFGRTQVSLIILILGSALIGALVMSLLGLFKSIRSAMSFRTLRREQEELQAKVKDLEEAKLFLEAELARHASTPADDISPGNGEEPNAGDGVAAEQEQEENE